MCLRKIIFRAMSVFGVASLAFLLGAAVIFFDLPSSEFLRKAFIGARAAYERRQALSGPNLPASGGALPVIRVELDKAEQTSDGFTLMTIMAEESRPGPINTMALLVNMRGDIVHQWQAPFTDVWPRPNHVRFSARDRTLCIFGCHLYGNGDLLVVYQGLGTPTYGYGLAKLDKDSRVLWKYSANAHHDVDVAEDGTIYAIEQKVVRHLPAGLEFVPVPCLLDSLVLLSPEGVKLKEIPILEALRDSPYFPLLDEVKGGPSPGMQPGATFDDARRRDILHLNSVKVLTRKLAPKFPMFKAGQVLLSMCHLDTIAVFDVDSGKLVWAARGPWEAQHDPQFLDNGRLLLFDNRGSPTESRVLEYDPETQGFPWSYSGENAKPFLSKLRGMSQRLPNGNTLIVNSDAAKILEVTRDKETVWSCSTGGFMTSGRRFVPEELPFLKGGPRARP